MNSFTKFKFYFPKGNPGTRVKALQLTRETAPTLFEFVSQFYHSEVRLKTDFLGSPTIFTYNNSDDVQLKTSCISIIDTNDWVIWHPDDDTVTVSDNEGFKENYRRSPYIDEKEIELHAKIDLVLQRNQEQAKKIDILEHKLSEIMRIIGAEEVKDGGITYIIKENNNETN